MGYSLAWLAVRGKPREAVLKALDLQDTGQREEIAESEINGAELPGGWYLVIKDHEDHVASDKVVAELSLGHEAVTCFVEEHCTFSCAAGWKDGRKAWSVTHDSSRKRRGLEIEGTPPEMFGPVREDLTSKQTKADVEKRGVDYIFDIPVELAKHITGYRHDMDIPGLEKTAFEVLKQNRDVQQPPSMQVPESKPWWKFW